MLNANALFYMKLVQYNKYLVSTLATDGLVHQLQVIDTNNCSAQYASHLFPAVYGLSVILPWIVRSDVFRVYTQEHR